MPEYLAEKIMLSKILAKLRTPGFLLNDEARVVLAELIDRLSSPPSGDEMQAAITALDMPDFPRQTGALTNAINAAYRARIADVSHLTATWKELVEHAS